MAQVMLGHLPKSSARYDLSEAWREEAYHQLLADLLSIRLVLLTATMVNILTVFKKRTCLSYLPTLPILEGDSRF